MQKMIGKILWLTLGLTAVSGVISAPFQG